MQLDDWSDMLLGTRTLPHVHNHPVFFSALQRQVIGSSLESNLVSLTYAAGRMKAALSLFKLGTVLDCQGWVHCCTESYIAMHPVPDSRHHLPATYGITMLKMAVWQGS